MIDNKFALKKQIIAENFDWIDDIFLTTIPDEEVEKVNKTILLISDINTEFIDFGNNDFSRVKSLMQVQIYFSKKSNINFNEATIELVHFFIQKCGYLSNGYSSFVDPGTLQNSMTIKIQKTN